jgi:hypothetical protein
MPLFYLHIRENGVLRKDPEGSEFATIEQAAEEAVRSAQDIFG